MLDWCMKLCSVLFSGWVGMLKWCVVVVVLLVDWVRVGSVVRDVRLVVSRVMYRWDGCG